MISTTLANFRENLLTAGVSHATAATLCGLKPSTLSSAFREIMRLDSTKEAELLTVSYRLVKLRNALKPLTLPESAGDLRQLLNNLEDGLITPETIKEAVSLIFQQ
jgi:hypothetical protein